MGEALQPQLIQAAARRNLLAIYQVYYHTRDYAYFVARCYVKTEKDLQAVLTDGYIQAIGRLQGYDFRISFQQWLHGKLAAGAVKVLKGKKVKFGSADGMMMPYDERELFPAAWLEQEQRRWEVLRLLDALPDPQRMALVMHYLGGMQTAQIAQAMAVDERAAASHLAGAKNALRAALGGQGGDGAAGEPPVMTRLLERESGAVVMPRELAKAVFEGMLLFFLENQKLPAEKGAKAGAVPPVPPVPQPGMGPGTADPAGAAGGSPFAAPVGGAGAAPGASPFGAPVQNPAVAAASPYGSPYGAAAPAGGGGVPFGIQPAIPLPDDTGKEGGGFARSLITVGIVLVLFIGLAFGYYQFIWKRSNDKARQEHLAWYESSKAAEAAGNMSVPEAGEENLEIGNGEYLDPEHSEEAPATAPPEPGGGELTLDPEPPAEDGETPELELGGEET